MVNCKKINKYLFVRWNLDNLLSQMVKSEGYDYIAAYKGERCKLLSVVREMWFRVGFPFRRIWYNSKLKNYPYTIIVNDAMMTEDYLSWMKKNNPDARLIFWYWNNVTNHVIAPAVVRNLGYELWSYSKKDCNKYGMKFNTQFYSESFYKACSIKPDIEMKQDICFVGKDKGRMNQIYDLQQDLSIEIDAYFVADHFYEFYKNKKYHIKPLQYKEMLQKYMESKAILDIVTDVDGGISLRILDGLYYKKKIITNCIAVKQYDFYHPDNIFVLGDRKKEEIPSFLTSSYHQIEDGLISNYNFNEWLKRLEQVKNETFSIS